LDTSPLSLCWHNKTLLPAKLPQCPVSLFKIPVTPPSCLEHVSSFRSACLRCMWYSPIHYQFDSIINCYRTSWPRTTKLVLQQPVFYLSKTNSSDAKEARGHKTEMGRLTLILCAKLQGPGRNIGYPGFSNGHGFGQPWKSWATPADIV
jgi:hypothetical protein